MGDNELTSLPLWPHGLESESEREQRNSGWSRSAHTPIKRISEHRDTISCLPLCCTNDLIDMKGRCCPKIVVSIPLSFFTSGQLRHIGGTVPKTSLNSDIFLGDCAIGNGISIPRGRRFHSRKYVERKISIGIYFHISTQYKPIIGRISACHGI